MTKCVITLSGGWKGEGKGTGTPSHHPPFRPPVRLCITLEPLCLPCMEPSLRSQHSAVRRCAPPPTLLGRTSPRNFAEHEYSHCKFSGMIPRLYQCMRLGPCPSGLRSSSESGGRSRRSKGPVIGVRSLFTADEKAVVGRIPVGIQRAFGVYPAVWGPSLPSGDATVPPLSPWRRLPRMGLDTPAIDTRTLTPLAHEQNRPPIPLRARAPRRHRTPRLLSHTPDKPD